jgi:hypothetical protein
VSLVALCSALVLLCSAASASAATVTVGQSNVNPTDAVGLNVGYVEEASQGNAYTFTSAGTVASFDTRAYNIQDPFAAASATAVIYRPISGGQFTIVARSNPKSLGAAGVLSSGTFTPAATVQAGDVLGLETTGYVRALYFFNGGPPDAVRYYGQTYAPTGGTQSTSTPFSYRVSVSVPLVTGPNVTSCVLSSVRRKGSPGFAGNFDQGDVTVAATLGLQSISNVQVTNGAVSVPSFSAGTRAPVIVTTTKSTQGQLTRFSFVANDSGGGTKFCA